MPEQLDRKIDFRMYIGLFFFYWQTIVVLFLYFLLAGVIYIQVSPKLYKTSCRLMVHRDVNLDLPGIAVSGRRDSPWQSFTVHSYLLKSDVLRGRVANELMDKWGEVLGSRTRMMLPIDVARARDIGSTLDISVESRHPEYAREFLSRLVDLHQDEWLSIQRSGTESASTVLEKELSRLEEDIDKAENDLIEYQRLHDIARVEASASMESQYLSALMSRDSMLATELMLLDSQYPELQNANAGVISDVGRLTRETGEIEPASVEPPDGRDMSGRASGRGESGADAPLPKIQLPEELTKKKLPDVVDEGAAWRTLRVKLVQMEQEEQALRRDLESNHPRVRTIRREIEDIQGQLEIAAKTEMGRLRDRHRALMIQKAAVEKAVYQWQAKNLLSSKRRSELKRLAGVLERYQRNYNTMDARLHDMRVVEELSAERFKVIEDVKTDARPVWPDPLKVLVVVLVLGLGSGAGIAVVAHTLDNKVQSIQDVEKDLGIEFLGGIPFWVHSGLDVAIRPIVTEEFSSGATEAYRSLRTSILSALEKINEKTVLVTSADSREGKTLTTLNLSIMIAQMGKKVLLADMDLRRGRMHRSLGVDKEPGITNVLEGSSSLKDVIKKTRFEGLFAAPSGRSIDNVAELLQTLDLKAIFAEVKDDYDYIFIDTSPVLRVTDTVIMASSGLGAVVYVARVNKTPKPMIQYSLGMLEDAKVLGLIMNSIEMHKISSLYYAYQYPAYAYYSNAYAYGDDYYYDDKSGRRKGRKKRRATESLDKRWHKFERWLRRTFLPME